MEINTTLRERRIEKGLTLSEVARDVGVSAATISRWESGDIANMKRDKIVNLANALDLSPAVIMGWEHEGFETTKSYYMNKESAELAEFLFNKPEYKVLFEASKKVKPEDIPFITEMIDRMSNK